MYVKIILKTKNLKQQDLNEIQPPAASPQKQDFHHYRYNRQLVLSLTLSHKSYGITGNCGQQFLIVALDGICLDSVTHNRNRICLHTKDNVSMITIKKINSINNQNNSLIKYKVT